MSSNYLVNEDTSHVVLDALEGLVLGNTGLVLLDGFPDIKARVACMQSFGQQITFCAIQ